MIFVEAMILTATLAITPVQENAFRPHLVIAQGIVESGMNKYAKGKAGEKGAWQALEKYWGKVPHSIVGQRAHHMKIMNDLVQEKRGNISAAIVGYNGKGKKAKKYFCKVRRKSFELAIIQC